MLCMFKLECVELTRHHATIISEHGDSVGPNDEAGIGPTTTNLRVVFYASAASSVGVSLNNTVLAGPSLYPAIWFRIHTVALSSDMSEMFREIPNRYPGNCIYSFSVGRISW